MNEPDDGDSSLSAKYENSYVPNVNPLKVNDHNTNLIVLSGSSGSGGGSVESGDGP